MLGWNWTVKGYTPTLPVDEKSTSTGATASTKFSFVILLPFEVKETL